MAAKLRCDKCDSENKRTEAYRKTRYHVCLDCGHIYYAKQRHQDRSKIFKYCRPEGVESFAETNDCAVRATAIAAGLQYKDAHALYDLAGRQQRTGTYVWTMTKAFETAKELGIASIEPVTLTNQWKKDETALFDITTLTRADEDREYTRRSKYGYTIHCYRPKYKAVTLAMLKPHVANGRYIATNRNHAFAIIDGIVHDGGYQGPQTQISNLWKVQDAKS